MKKFVFLGCLILFSTQIALLGCATVPKGPLQPDEVRVTKVKIIETERKAGVGKYKAIIEYRHGEEVTPEDIYLACTTWHYQIKT